MPAGVAEQDYHIEFENHDAIHPIRSGPPPKRGFLPSKHEHQKIKKLVRLLREGKIQKWDDEQAKKEKKGEDAALAFDIWHDDVAERKNAPTAMPAPKIAYAPHYNYSYEIAIQHE
jgi:ribosome biogenesis protein ERB1